MMKKTKLIPLKDDMDTDSDVVLVSKGKPKHLCGSISALKQMEMAVLSVSIYQSVAYAQTVQRLL